MSDPAADALLARLATWRHRGLTHAFLGHPGSPMMDKTTVEPGGASSPGLWTFGVSWWIDTGAGWTCAEDLDASVVTWRLIDAPGGAPESISRWRVGGADVVHRLAHVGDDGALGLDAAECSVSVAHPCRVRIGVGVTGVGPAGGTLAGAVWDAAQSMLSDAGGRHVRLEAVAQAALGDGQAALVVEIDAAPGRPALLRATIAHGAADRAFAGCWMPPTVAARPAAVVFTDAARAWTAGLPARLHADDARVALAWERCAWHIQAAMECRRPRIGVANYPILWQRDGVIILRALDLMGRSDLARPGLDDLAPTVFGGGFGAEADAPGAGIWALAAHARTTGDDAWLARRFPAIAERAEWIARLRTATAPIHAMADTRTPAAWDSPASTLVCVAASDGLIRGRMDWHHPDFYINAWSLCGLREAAWAATRLGRTEAAAWTAQADDLEARIAAHLLPAYGNDRDPACAPHPTGALVGHPGLTAALGGWLRQRRIDATGRRIPEREWTYFEAAQAHNALRIGLREEAWVLLDGLLAPDGPRDAAAFIEGPPDGGEMLPFGRSPRANGWLAPGAALGGNMPHNWTTAELMLALRDVLVREAPGGIVIGAGVPRRWLSPGARFGCTGLPIADGARVSWTATVGADCRIAVEYDGPHPFRTAFPE